MSKKMRIIISFVLVAAAFALGVFVYTRENGNDAKVANADGEEVFFVNAEGKIAIPVEPEPKGSAENKKNRGTEGNPFFVLEIVPYDREAEFGYHIAGCEPIDMEVAGWYKVNLPNQYYTTNYNKEYQYWESEVPAKFPKDTPGFGKQTTDQYGTMQKLTDNSGNYTLAGSEYVKIEPIPAEYTGARYKKNSETEYVEDANGEYIKRDTFAKAENGDYLWTPLPPVTCKNMKNSNTFKPYTDSLHVPDAENKFLMCIKDCGYYAVTGYEYKHKNTFVLESVGLGYKYVDGVRLSIEDHGTQAEKDQMKKDVEEFSKNCVVYTVTPEDLNINQELIDRADMIYIKGQYNAVVSITSDKPYYNSIYRDELFKHADTEIAKRNKNMSGATFETNPLDWGAAIKIYKAATNSDKIVPVIMDTKAYHTGTQTTAKVPIVCADTSQRTDRGLNGYSHNVYKLFLLLHQMPSKVLENFYGSPADVNGVFSSKNTGEKLKDKVTPLTTGVFNFEKVSYIAGNSTLEDHVNKSDYTAARTTWNAFTLIPWQLIPNTDAIDTKATYLDALEIKSDTGYFKYNGGDAQNSLQDGVYLYNGSTYMTTEFNEASALEDNQYGHPVFEFFDSINGTSPAPGEVTTAQVLYYLLNGLRRTSTPTAELDQEYKVLEVQPHPIYLSDTFWETFFLTYTNTTKKPVVDQMTTGELICKNVELLGEYDLIYFGINKSATDPTMKFSGTDFIYSHVGPKYSIDGGKTSFFGWLYTKENVGEELSPAQKAIENQFVYSGNDLTLKVRDEILSFGAKGYPVVFGHGFYDSSNPGSANNIIDRIDHNSYIYDVGSQIAATNYIYLGTLGSATNVDHITEASNLRNALRKSVEVSWDMLSSPKLYNSPNADSESAYLDEKALAFKFKLNAPSSMKFKVELFVDLNGDGKFTDNEMLADNDRMNFTITSGAYSYTNGNIVGGKEYIVKRSNINSRVGSVSWKLNLVGNSDNKVYQSLSGISAIRAAAGKEITIKVLQIISNYRNTVLLPMDSEINKSTGTVTLTNIDNSRMDTGGSGTNVGIAQNTAAKFYKYTKDLKDFKLQFVRTTQTELLNINDSGPGALATYLGGFDMIVLGFGDAYDGVSSDTVINAIEDFRLAGKAILYSHDTSSMVGKGTPLKSNSDLNDNYGWGSNITLKFRDSFGMDRFDVLGCKADKNKNRIPEDRADLPYKPSTSDDGALMMADSNRMLVQGFGDGHMYRIQKLSNNLEAKKIGKINMGGLTEYPYTINESINIATTHTQYYQLDMESDAIVVWYALGDVNGDPNSGTPAIKDYYNNKPLDGRNNYYIYNIDNVTYSGMGHSGKLEDDEVKLFINTFIAAYRAGVQSVGVEVVNEDVSGNITNGFYLNVDLDSEDGGQILQINDAQTDYEKYKVVEDEDGVKTVTSEIETVTRQSKRVYFVINDGNINTPSGAEYFLKFSLYDSASGEYKEVPLVVRRKADNAIVDVTKPGSGINLATKNDEYYVDIPIALEDESAVVGNQKVAETKLKIEVAASIKMTPTSVPLEPTPMSTEVSITPRGLFDLD